jgi:hypothetical protein
MDFSQQYDKTTATPLPLELIKIYSSTDLTNNFIISINKNNTFI